MIFKKIYMQKPIKKNYSLNTLLIISIHCIFFNSCDTNNINEDCFKSKKVSFDFSKSSFNFGNNDLLIIDDFTFRHSYYLDSLNIGFYLPKEEIIILEVGGKIAKQKTNNITYSRFLANHLQNSNIYTIDNPNKLLALGILDIKRKDGKKVQVCGTENLLRNIKAIH
jgi:hypothetical protein